MNSLLSRRRFLGTSTRHALAAAGLGLAGQLAAIEPFNRPGSPRLFLSLAAYSFRDAFAQQKLDLFQFIDYCADHGCAGAELTSYYFPEKFDNAFLSQVRRHAFLRGVAISGTAVGNTFTLGKGDKRDREIALVKRWVDHAQLLSAPHIRVFAGTVPKDMTRTEAKRNCIEALEECCAYAGTKGVILGIENHGGIVAEPDDLLEIVRSVQSPWVGVNLDTANFHTDDVYGALAKAAPYAVNVQMKSEIQPKGQAVQLADLPRLVKILRDANYQGYVALEYEAKEEASQAVPGLLAKMKALLEAA